MKTVFAATTIITALLTNNVAAAEPQSCKMATITKDIKNSLQERRERTFDHCLTCQGNRCELKRWPMDDGSQKLAEMCKTFFCTPVRIRASTFVPDQRDLSAMTYFIFEISEVGRASNVELTSWSGDFDDAEEALEWVEAFLQSIRYEPIRIGDQPYVITNLKGSARFR